MVVIESLFGLSGVDSYVQLVVVDNVLSSPVYVETIYMIS